MGSLGKTNRVSSSWQALQLNTAMATSIWGGGRKHIGEHSAKIKNIQSGSPKTHSSRSADDQLGVNKQCFPFLSGCEIEYSNCSVNLGRKHMWAQHYLHKHKIWQTKTHESWPEQGQLDENKVRQVRLVLGMQHAWKQLLRNLFDAVGGVRVDQCKWAMECADHSRTQMWREWQKSLMNRQFLRFKQCILCSVPHKMLLP